MISKESTLRVARIAASVKLADAARHIGVADTLLSRFERMKDVINSRQIERLAELYECDPNALHGHQPLHITAQLPRVRR